MAGLMQTHPPVSERYLPQNHSHAPPKNYKTHLPIPHCGVLLDDGPLRVGVVLVAQHDDSRQ